MQLTCIQTHTERPITYCPFCSLCCVYLVLQLGPGAARTATGHRRLRGRWAGVAAEASGRGVCRESQFKAVMKKLINARSPHKTQI